MAPQLVYLSSGRLLFFGLLVFDIWFAAAAPAAGSGSSSGSSCDGGTGMGTPSAACRPLESCRITHCIAQNVGCCWPCRWPGLLGLRGVENGEYRAAPHQAAARPESVLCAFVIVERLCPTAPLLSCSASQQLECCHYFV